MENTHVGHFFDADKFSEMCVYYSIIRIGDIDNIKYDNNTLTPSPTSMSKSILPGLIIYHAYFFFVAVDLARFPGSRMTFRSLTLRGVISTISSSDM